MEGTTPRAMTSLCWIKAAGPSLHLGHLIPTLSQNTSTVFVSFRATVWYAHQPFKTNNSLHRSGYAQEFLCEHCCSCSHARPFVSSSHSAAVLRRVFRL